ncbi:hypothetical protein HDU76_011402 [Blyttiomyces sp. JEL0837]|nr:hypothetical protein HDU76_011402 [Blyttiomyces sp. JEL0837]
MLANNGFHSFNPLASLRRKSTVNLGHRDFHHQDSDMTIATSSSSGAGTGTGGQQPRSQDDFALPASVSVGNLASYAGVDGDEVHIEDHVGMAANGNASGMGEEMMMGGSRMDGNAVGIPGDALDSGYVAGQGFADGVPGMEQLSMDGGDEKIVQMLCDFESGFALLLDRIKENMHSTKEAVAFLKKRATIEEEYGKSMVKLAQSITTQKSDGKEGSYNESWKQFVSVHEKVGEIRLKFGQAIAGVAEELSSLHKNTERSRKQLKEAGVKHWRVVHDSENNLEKAKTRYESLSEEWERAILNKEDGGSSGLAGRRQGMTKSFSTPIHLWMQSSNNPAKLQKIEEDARAKAATANENYKKQLDLTNVARANYFQIHLPRFIRMLKETNDACDKGLQSQLLKYASDAEDYLMQEASTLSPVDKDKLEMGIVRILQKVDLSKDFEEFMSDATISAEAAAIALPRTVFGVDLTLLAERDGQLTPLLVTQCIQAVERYGLRVQGLYRVSGTTSLIHKLKIMFDRDGAKVNMEEWADHVAVITGTLKLYFRELPQPLLPKNMYHEFIDAARVDDERMRLIRTHELVNQLPDAHYATLQTLMGHLWRVQQLETENKMGIQNLAIVWGPTLMDSPESNHDPEELRLQSRVIETILTNYDRIFEA